MLAMGIGDASTITLQINLNSLVRSCESFDCGCRRFKFQILVGLNGIYTDFKGIYF